MRRGPWSDRRSLEDIFADLLAVLERGYNITNIVCKANLNFARCKDHMRDMHARGLVKIVTNSPSSWVVTDKGHEFLKKHEELKGMLATGDGVR